MTIFAKGTREKLDSLPGAATHPPEAVSEVRSQLTNRAILVFTLFGTVAVAASLLRARDFGWQNLMYSHIAAYVLLALTAILHRRLSFRAAVLPPSDLVVRFGRRQPHGLGGSAEAVWHSLSPSAL